MASVQNASRRKGQVTSPIKLAGRLEIKALPRSPEDDRIQTAEYRPIYSQPALNIDALRAVPPIAEVSRAEARINEFAVVLAICPVAEDHVRLHEILLGSDHRLYEALTWREGAEALARHQPHVLICEDVLPDADWKEVLDLIALRMDAPRLIVISSQAGTSLWAEVLNLGGYDMLPKPLVQDEVVRVVGLAFQNWKSERDRQGKQPASLLEKEKLK